MAKLVRQFTGQVSFNINIETLGDPDEVMNKLFDLFAEIDTTELGVTWDDCEWDLEETCFTCGGKGEALAYDGNGVQMEITCPDCGEEQCRPSLILATASAVANRDTTTNSTNYVRSALTERNTETSSYRTILGTLDTKKKWCNTLIVRTAQKEEKTKCQTG